MPSPPLCPSPRVRPEETSRGRGWTGRTARGPGRRGARGGFTIIEVLVALAIFVLVVVPLLDLALTAAAQTARVNQQRRAHYTGLAYMEELLNTVPVFRGERAEKKGDFEVRARTEEFMQQYGLEKVTVQVFLAGEKESLDDLVVYRLR